MGRDENGDLNGYVDPWVKQRDGETEETVLIFVLHEEDDWEPADAPGQS